MSITKYQDYRDSGVEWLGEVPAHWKVTRLKHVKSKQRNAFVDGPFGSNLKSEHFLDTGTVFVVESGFATSGELDEEKLKRISEQHFATISRSEARERDIIIAKIGARYGMSSILPRLSSKAVVSGNSLKLTMDTETMSVDYAHALMLVLKSCGAMDDDVNVTAQPALSLGGLSNLLFLRLPLAEQTQIAKFLDYETVRIDTLIEKQQQLIALLKEKRQAVISHAVTKGLNPDAPMRDSGVEWLGEVPAHWGVHCFRYCARDGHKNFTDGDWVESPFITTEGVRLLQTGNVGIGEFREKGFRYISAESFKRLNCTEIKPGDVLICRLDGPVGRACLVPDLGVKMITSVDNAILKTSDRFDSRFLVYLMTSSEWIGWIDNICRAGGGFRFRISRTMLGNQFVPAPPLKEQEAIADLLDEGRSRFEELIQKSEEAVTLLQERRTALISAAVTGKIDVRSWKAPECEAETEAA